jgi:hypothetical protein
MHSGTGHQQVGKTESQQGYGAEVELGKRVRSRIGEGRTGGRHGKADLRAEAEIARSMRDSRVLPPRERFLQISRRQATWR